MNDVWVDTDFGFDDLWALLVLRHYGCTVAGVSLVAGNAPLAQVAENAVAAKTAYGFGWALWQGAARPLTREPETAQRILGPTGMRSRGLRLGGVAHDTPPTGAVEAMTAWLTTDPDVSHDILALGPLTNIARLLRSDPALSERINRLVWMGGSVGAGNHTAKAEFNAVADAESLAVVVGSGVRLDIVDLTFCRSVTFGPDDLPDTDPLTLDLVGGYLDIALERGRSGMAIYDPLAALAICKPDTVTFQACSVAVKTDPNDAYGATTMTPDATAQTRVSVAAKGELMHMCMKALERGPNGTRR